VSPEGHDDYTFPSMPIFFSHYFKLTRIIGLFFLLNQLVLSAPLHSRTPGGTIALKGTVYDTLRRTVLPYLVTENITVPEGESLYIQPGVRIMFQSFAKLDVKGKLFCNGTKIDPINFSGPENSHNKEDSAAVSWGGIYFNGENSGGEISHAIIQNAEYGIYCNRSDTVVIFNNVLKNNKVSGIYCVSESNPIISHNTIMHSQYGIECYDYSSPIIQNNQISKTLYAGIYCFMQSHPTLRNNVITGSAGPGVYCVEQSNPALFNNIIVGNANGINCANASPIINRNTINQNHENGIVCYGLSNPLIAENNIFANNHFDMRNYSKYAIDISQNWWGYDIVKYNPKEKRFRFDLGILKGIFKIEAYARQPFEIPLEQPRSVSSLRIMSSSDSLNKSVYIGDKLTVEVHGIDGSPLTKDYTGIQILTQTVTYSVNKPIVTSKFFT